MTTLHEQLRADLHAAMRAKDSVRRDTIRMLEAAIKNLEIAKQTLPTDEDVVGLILKQIRQREESMEMFERGGRAKLAAKERAEIAVLEPYLPQQLSRDEIMEAVRAQIQATGASGPGDKGKVMGPLMAALHGKADGRLINAVVTELLGG